MPSTGAIDFSVPRNQQSFPVSLLANETIWSGFVLKNIYRPPLGPSACAYEALQVLSKVQERFEVIQNSSEGRT